MRNIKHTEITYQDIKVAICADQVNVYQNIISMDVYVGIGGGGKGWGVGGKKVNRWVDFTYVGFPNHCLLAYISLGCLDFPLT